jgi:hypothetical protein
MAEAPDLPQRTRARPKTVGLLDSSNQGTGTLARRHMGCRLSWGFDYPVDLLAVCLVLRQLQRAETEGARCSGLTLPFCLYGCNAALFMHAAAGGD